MKLALLYRGPLSSCNYGCSYCPFAKRRESAEEIGKDRLALERFVGWAAGRAADRLSLLFTPWGEALVRPWYRSAIAALTRMPHVERAVIQTNLSGGLGWLDLCDTSKLALWCSYHPTEVARPRFLARCRELDGRGVRFSVGAVGLEEHESEIRALREELPRRIYLWINAYKSRSDYYREEDLRRLEAIDPHFRVNHGIHRSAGLPCAAGETVVSVDGDGTIRRCHFIREPIGNLYGAGIEAALSRRPCTRARCECHIGYVHLEPLGLGRIFEGGVLERIPAGWDRGRGRSSSDRTKRAMPKAWPRSGEGEIDVAEDRERTSHPSANKKVRVDTPTLPGGDAPSLEERGRPALSALPTGPGGRAEALQFSGAP